MPMHAAQTIVESANQSLARPMNSKLEPGWMSSRNLSLAMTVRLDRDRVGRAPPAHVVIEEEPGAPDLREQGGEDSDHQHHGESLDRSRTVLVEHPPGRQRRDVAVEDGGEAAVVARVDRSLDR